MLSFTAPARRPRKGDAKVRTGVRRRSGCVTGAGGEASKARNAEVCLRAGWRLRRPAAGAPSASAARRLRRTRPNAERRRWTSGGREQVSGRFVGCTQAAVALLDGGGFATARGRPDDHLPIPRPGADPARQDAMSRRTRQNAQPVHAVRLAPPPVSSPVRLRVLRGETTCYLLQLLVRKALILTSPHVTPSFVRGGLTSAPSFGCERIGCERIAKE